MIESYEIETSWVIVPFFSRISNLLFISVISTFPKETKKVIKYPIATKLGNNAVGYIQITENPSTSTAWVINMAVLEEIRHKGIGSALLYAAQSWAAKRNLRRMVLEMQSKNFPAIQLANKLGYEFSGYNDHYYENRDIALFFSIFLR